MSGGAGKGEICLVVGAGQAGGHAAVAARRAGYAGRLVLVGEESARPYERPFLSKELLHAEEPPAPPFLHARELYRELDIELRPGLRIEGIDFARGRARAAQGAGLPFDRLVLATGGRARRLKLPGAEHALYLRTVEDGLALRGRLRRGLRLVVIGAGVVGLEVASSAVRRGCTVAVIEPAARVMGRALPPEPAAFLARLHRSAGVALHLETSVLAIEERRGGFVVTSSSGRLEADLVVAGIGMERNVELAQQAGLAVDVGILVDAGGRASHPGTHAAGDVAAFWHPGLQRRLMLETWKHAQDHGIHVGRQIAGLEAVYDCVPWFWSDQHGANLQVAGLPGSGSLVPESLVDEDGRFEALYHDAAGRPAGAVAVDGRRLIRSTLSALRQAWR